MRTEQITTTPFPNSNSNDPCISKNVNDVENAIRHNEIMIHPNSNFCNITGGKIIPINKESEINGVSKENMSRFLLEYKSLRAPSRKESKNQIS